MFTTQKFKVEVETRGDETLGMTVVDRRRFHREENLNAVHEVVDWVDAPRFHAMIMERVGKGG